MTGPRPDSNKALPRLARIWLGVVLMLVVLANVWPLLPVEEGGLAPRLEAMSRQGPDFGTALALLVWLGVGALATLAMASGTSLTRRIKVAGVLGLVALLVEVIQTGAATRHASLVDGIVGGAAAAALPMLWRNPSHAWGRLLWAMAGVTLIGAMIVLPILALQAANRTAFDNWSEGFPLVAGAERNGHHAWPGSLPLVAIYPRAIDRDGLALLSALPVDDTGAALRQSLEPIYLETVAGPVQGADKPLLNGAETDPLLAAVQTSGGITIEIVAESDPAAEIGNARILTLSPGRYRRNFSVSQDGTDLLLNIRTPWSGTNAKRQGEMRWPDLFDAPGPQHILISYTGNTVHVFANGDRAGPARTLYHPRLDFGHGGWIGDLVALVIFCGACGVLAAGVAPQTARWELACVLAPGMVVFAGLALVDGSLWTATLLAVGVASGLGGVWLVRTADTLAHGTGTVATKVGGIP
ncbi:MAG: hypothetical protein AAFR00_02255 [Pseudomonadota bacterium]